jgi:hypothetical protein
VKLTGKELEWIEQLKSTGKYGETDAEVLRYAFFTWWIGKFMHGPKHAAPT